MSFSEADLAFLDGLGQQLPPVESVVAPPVRLRMPDEPETTAELYDAVERNFRRGWITPDEFKLATDFIASLIIQVGEGDNLQSMSDRARIAELKLFPHHSGEIEVELTSPVLGREV